MRVRDHIALSTTGAALVHPWLRNDAFGVWAGGVLIDLDHYLWFCVRTRSWNPAAAVRFFNEADPPQYAATRVLHSPVAPMLVLLLGIRRRALFCIGLGMLLHIALDRVHDARMDKARAAALERDSLSCQACGTRGPDVGTHLRTQPFLLPSYAPQHIVALCGPCHEAVHAG